jgi:hypothetical protein
MSKRNGESVDHLLLHCEVACAIWNVFLRRFGLSWVMPRRVVDLYGCWWTADNTRSVALWKMVLSFFFFVVSLEENE